MDEIKTMFASINANMQAMDGKLTDVVNELRDIKMENEAMKRQIKVQETKIANLEREVRRKNLIIRGIPDDEDEDPRQTKEKIFKICETLGVDVKSETDVDEARRIGKPVADRQRPVLLKLTTANKKMEILRETKRLKGSEIWIDEDYPKDILEERKLLIPKLKEARNKGHRAQLRYNKLIINGEVCDIDNSKQLASAGQGKSGGEKRKTNVRSPESNNLDEQLRKITRTSKNACS